MLQELNFGPQSVTVPATAAIIRVNKGPVRFGTATNSDHRQTGPGPVTAGATLSLTGPGQIEWFQSNGEPVDAANIGIVDNYSKVKQVPQTYTRDSDGDLIPEDERG